MTRTANTIRRYVRGNLDDLAFRYRAKPYTRAEIASVLRAVGFMAAATGAGYVYDGLANRALAITPAAKWVRSHQKYWETEALVRLTWVESRHPWGI